MSVRPIQTTQYETRKKGANFLNAAVVGGTCGAFSRYVLPSKTQMDSFVSTAKNAAKNRSILKYAGGGAIIALALASLKKVFDKFTIQDSEFDKLDVLMDASPDACAILWYGDNQ